MAQKRHHNNKRQQSAARAPQTSTLKAPPAVIEKKLPVQFGSPFVLLEDAQKNTFQYSNGEWVHYTMSIAECRENCQVKELPQKVNGRTRYEVRCPTPTSI